MFTLRVEYISNKGGDAYLNYNSNNHLNSPYNTVRPIDLNGGKLMASIKNIGSPRYPNWQARVSIIKSDGTSGTKNKQGFSTKREAEIWAGRTEENKIKHHSFENNIFFIDYSKNWYVTFKKGKHSPKTNKDYELAIDRAQEYFGQTKIQEISRQNYQSFLNWLANTVDRRANIINRKNITLAKAIIKKTSLYSSLFARCFT